MKILYILGAYKPRMSANGICSDMIINELLKNQHQVTVLCNASHGCPAYDNPCGALEVHRVKPRLFVQMDDWSDFYKSEYPVAAAWAQKIGRLVNKISLLFSLPFWPLVSYFSLRRFCTVAWLLHKKKKFDLIISVYTPIETLLAGYYVKKKAPEVLLIPYFLDSLSGGFGPKCFSRSTQRRKGLKIEKKIFEVADKVVLMSSSWQHHLEFNRQFFEKFVNLDIPLLCSDLPHLMPRRSNRKTTKLLFIGSISAAIRNPNTLISALEHLDDADVECEFVGNIDCKERFLQLRMILGKRLIFTDFIGHDKVLQKIEEADFLLNIGNLINTMVPSKIFEYMSYGKPIISTYDIADDTSKSYLEKYPLCLLLSHNISPEDNGRALKVFIEEMKKKSISVSALKETFYANTPEAFSELVINRMNRSYQP